MAAKISKAASIDEGNIRAIERTVKLSEAERRLNPML
jgi:hypothetical protein